MLAFLGDIHGNFNMLRFAVETAKSKGAVAVIQVGDFGFYPSVVGGLKAVELALPVYAVDGNHEDHKWLWNGGADRVQQHSKGLVTYVPRGTVLELDGRRIAFFGGAGSIDQFVRVKYGMHWSAEEQISDNDVARLLASVDAAPVDALITHTPPQEVITQHFDNPPHRAVAVRRAFGAPPDWFDPSAHKVEAVWNQLGRPKIFCGHMHRSVTYYENNGYCRILNIDEVMYW